MTARLTVIIFIFLCLEAGVALILFPWVSGSGISDWGDNYLLVYVANQTGMPGLRTAVSSGWVRGAVTALGVLNLMVAFWEIANFKRAVAALEGKPMAEKNVTARKSSSLPDNERRGDR